MLKDYVVMKAAQKTNGKRGRTSLVKLLRGSQSPGTCKLVDDFDLFDLWGVFTGMPLEEVNQIFDTLAEKGYIYTEEVNAGNLVFPMICISDDGSSLLFALECTEAEKLKEYRRHRRNSQIYLEITDKGKLLDNFLKVLVFFLNNYNTNSKAGDEPADILDEINIEYESRVMLEKFFYRRTHRKYMDRWRQKSIFDITLFEIFKDLRLFLSSLTELEAAIFRYHYNLEDHYFRPLEEILTYFMIPEMEYYGIVKRLISHFSHVGWMERFQFVRDISKFIDEISLETLGASDKLIKETSDVTYDLFTQGFTVPEIARVRGLAVSTVYNHFIKLIPQHNIDLCQVIPQERITLILKAINSLKEIDSSEENSLKAIKSKLPYDYNYGEINVVMTFHDG